VFALTATGFENVTCCQPLPLSLVNAALASNVPVFDQRRPTWVPVFCAPL